MHALSMPTSLRVPSSCYKPMSTLPQIISRRTLLKGALSGAAVSLSGSIQAQLGSADLPLPPIETGPSSLAQDEAFWREVASFYDRTEGVTNLEHGYWGKMARPVQEAYIAATKMVNAQNSFYARKDYGADFRESTRRAAEALGAQSGELVLTRNATEAIHNLIRQYQGLESGDKVLYTDIDYPSFKETMHWLDAGRDVSPVEVVLPARANQSQILDIYKSAFDRNPSLKLMLLTHVSNQHGLVLPVAAIAEEARGRGVDVICDTAQSWGLVDYKITDLNVDWAGFNLHKWIGSPVGVGALYMRAGSLEKIAPYPGEADPENTNAFSRVHTATSNFAAILAIPAALDFHQAIGGANKEARLRYLRSIWTEEAENLTHIEVLGGTDEASWTGMGSFRLAGQESVEQANALQQRLEKDFGIFTVVRRGLASGSCIRITPQVFTSADEIGQLVDALKKLA